MAEFVLANNYSEFLDKVFRQVSGTTVGTKFAPPCACIYMYEVERVFFRNGTLQTLNMVSVYT